LNGATATELSRQAIIRHAVWRPGCTAEDIGALDPRAFSGITPGAWDAEARLADMDAMGVDQALLYPTWFAEGFHLVRDPDVAYALARAYNDWILDFVAGPTSAAAAGCVLPLQTMLAGSSRSVDLGVRRVVMRPMWYPVRTPPARVEAQMRLAMELIIGHSPPEPGDSGAFVLSSHCTGLGRPRRARVHGVRARVRGQHEPRARAPGLRQRAPAHDRPQRRRAVGYLRTPACS
jgi:hypothetical protein